jgi:hypothetical protein
MHPNVSSPAFLASALAATTSAAAVGALYTKLTTRCDTPNGKEHRQRSDAFRIESHLMDKIQQKKYLSSAKEGIPSTLRILAIDLRELRTDAFTGHCRLSHDKVFLDEAAPPKEIQVSGDVHVDTKIKKNVSKSKKNTLSKLQIPQKALVKSLGGSLPSLASSRDGRFNGQWTVGLILNHC